MRLFIHAGLNKTGSSSVQSYLHHVRPGLAERGVIYPDLGARAHWRVAAELMQSDAQASRSASNPGYLDRLAEEQGVDGALEKLAALIREHRDGDQVMLISQENFSTRGTMKQLLAFLDEAAPGLKPTVLAYCREPAALFQSYVQHNIKSGKPYPHPAEWRSAHHARVKGLQGLCGEHLKLRCFSTKSLKDGDVVADFREWFGSEAGRSLPAVRRAFAANSALSAEGCALLIEAAEDASSPVRDVPNLRKMLPPYEASLTTRGKLVMPEEWRQLLRARLGTEWNAIVETMDHPADVKAGLRIEAELPDAVVAPDAVTRWLLSYSNDAYRDGLLAFVADRARRAEGARKAPAAKARRRASMA